VLLASSGAVTLLYAVGWRIATARLHLAEPSTPADSTTPRDLAVVPVNKNDG
jgi:hypothetical protein